MATIDLLGPARWPDYAAAGAFIVWSLVVLVAVLKGWLR